jgi:hypothetical protein
LTFMTPSGQSAANCAVLHNTARSTICKRAF